MIHASEFVFLGVEIAIVAGFIIGGIALVKKIKSKIANRKSKKTAQAKTLEKEQENTKAQTQSKTNSNKIRQKKKIAKKQQKFNKKTKNHSNIKHNMQNSFRTADNYYPKNMSNSEINNLKANIFEGNVEPNFVKSYVDAFGNKVYDKRNYIQSYNQESKNIFKDLTDKNNKDDFANPVVCQIDFNKLSGKAPLIVSTTNEQVLNDAIDVIIADSKNIVDSEKNKNLLFPIKIRTVDGNHYQKKTYNNLQEFNVLCDNVLGNTSNSENHKQKEVDKKNSCTLDELFEL